MNKGDKFLNTFVVTEEIYKNFIDSYRDRNPLHTDEAFAQSKGFKSVVMHGNILGGFLSFFIGECLPIKDVIIHSQEISYKHPVYLNDSLELHAEIAEVYESVNTYIFKYYFENKDVKKVAKGQIQIGILS